LLFLLKPNDSGWIIGVMPKTRCVENEDWVAVVNAPYRNYNSLHLDASYGITAEEAVKMGPRKLSFVVACEDYKQESRRLKIVLWPYTHSQAETDEALALLGTSPLGKAKLTILNFKVSRTEQDIDGKNFGKIDGLKFKVELSPPQRRTGR